MHKQASPVTVTLSPEDYWRLMAMSSRLQLATETVRRAEAARDEVLHQIAETHPELSEIQRYTFDDRTRTLTVVALELPR